MNRCSKITAQHLTELEDARATCGTRLWTKCTSPRNGTKRKCRCRFLPDRTRGGNTPQPAFAKRRGSFPQFLQAKLDHSSRSFVQHTQTQMEEVVRDAFDRATGPLAEAADTTSARSPMKFSGTAAEECKAQRVVHDTASASFCATSSDVGNRCNNKRREENSSRFRGRHFRPWNRIREEKCKRVSHAARLLENRRPNASGGNAKELRAS